MIEPTDSNGAPASPLRSESLRAGRSHLRAHWPWLLGLGIVLDVLGMIVLGSASFLSMRLLGWMIILAGVVRAIQAFRVYRPNASFIEVVTAVLYVLVGIWLVLRPVAEAGSTTNTLVISALLILDGMLHIAGAVMTRYPNWQWPLVYSILVMLFGLGLAIWQQFSHLRILALAWFLGITMILNGWSLIALGWTEKKLPEDAA